MNPNVNTDIIQMDSDLFIANEIVIEILSYYDIKTISKFNIICKAWNELVTSYIANYIVKNFEFTAKTLSDIVKCNDILIKKIFNYLTQKNKNLVHNYYSYLGNDEMTCYCIENGSVINDKTINYFVYGNYWKTKTINDDNSIVRRLKQHLCRGPSPRIVKEYDLFIKTLTRQGRIEMVEIFTSHKNEYFETESLLDIALKYGDNRIIDDLLNNFSLFLCCIDTVVAVKYNRTDILRRISIGMNCEMLFIDTLHIHLSTLKWIYNYFRSSVHVDLRKLIYKSIKHQRHDILEWCLSLDNRLDEKIIMMIVSRGKISLLSRFQDFDRHLSVHEARIDKRSVLINFYYQIKNNIEKYIKYIRYAVKNNHFDSLKWIANEIPSISHFISFEAERYGKTEIIQRLLIHGREIDWHNNATLIAMNIAHYFACNKIDHLKLLFSKHINLDTLNTLKQRGKIVFEENKYCFLCDKKIKFFLTNERSLKYVNMLISMYDHDLLI